MYFLILNPFAYVDPLVVTYMSLTLCTGRGVLILRSSMCIG